VNLKFAPDVRFRIDDRLDDAARIDAILRSPEVQRDIAKPRDEDDEDGE
jgi:ribosome-binding factor A